NITAETMLQLAEHHPTVHALKDSTGNTDQAAEIAGQARPEFRVYSGDDYLTLPMLSVGASGVVSVASHVIGREMKAIIDSFFKGDLDKARSLHYEYLALMKGLFTAPNPTCVKYALSKLGLRKENLRLPLVALDEVQKAAMNDLLRKHKLATAALA